MGKRFKHIHRDSNNRVTKIEYSNDSSPSGGGDARRGGGGEFAKVGCFCILVLTAIAEITKNEGVFTLAIILLVVTMVVSNW